MSTKILHNPRCSKSRQTLQLLNEQGIEPEVIEYLKTPPDHSTLDRILKQLNMQPRELMRKGQDEYHALKLDDPSLSREQLIDAMVQHPILIERPIVISDKGIALGRPPENVKKIL